MGDKKEFYASVFNFLLKMLNRYFSCGSIPWDERQEYEFFLGFHKDMDELLKLGKCSLIAELYRVFNGSVHCRQLQYCRDPKKMLSDLWKAFAGWSQRSYDATLSKDMNDFIEAFAHEWKELDIAAELIIILAQEVSCMKKEKASVA